MFGAFRGTAAALSGLVNKGARAFKPTRKRNVQKRMAQAQAVEIFVKNAERLLEEDRQLVRQMESALQKADQASSKTG
eukprot:tig00000144_g9046.t1